MALPGRHVYKHPPFRAIRQSGLCFRLMQNQNHFRSRQMNLKVVCVVAIASAFAALNADAFPSLPKYVADGFKDDKDYKPFLETVEGLKSKCDLCHKPGADKKARGHGLNDFGKVYHDRFKPKDFKAAEKEMKKDDAMKIFKAAWEKSILEKNADGKVYGDLIKDGKLPGKND